MAFDRKHLKQFAGSATNNGQFGSAQAGTKVLSLDPEVIQALSAWDNGWAAAVLSGQRLPSLEEMQGLQYVLSYHLGYMYQSGIPEYNAETEYMEKSIARMAGSYRLFGSLVDNNIGNALTDTDYWVEIIDLASVAVASQSEAENGVINNKMMTPLRVKQAIEFQTIGQVGQTWQDVIGSRSDGVTYTNSTGKPIQVVVTASSPANQTSSFSIDGNIVANGVAGNNTLYRPVYQLIIPDGSTYQLTLGGTSSLQLWWELR